MKEIQIKNIKKNLAEFLIILPLLIVSLGIFNMAPFAAAPAHSAYIPIPDALCGVFPCGNEADNGVQIAKSVVGKLIDNTRFIIGAIAILLIVISGIKLVTAQGNEEVLTEQTKALTFGIIGLFTVGLAGEIAAIFEVDRGGFLNDPSTMLQKSKLFGRTATIVITFIKYIIGSGAVLYVVRSSLRLVTSAGNEEEVAKDKKNILYGVLGLVLIMMANPVIKEVFFKIDTTKYPGIEAVRPGFDPKRLAQEIAGVTNLVAALAGPFALLSLVAGGVMYTVSAGEEEQTGKAKKIIMWSILGIVVIYGAFAIVSTFISRQFAGI